VNDEEKTGSAEERKSGRAEEKKRRREKKSIWSLVIGKIWNDTFFSQLRRFLTSSLPVFSRACLNLFVHAISCFVLRASCFKLRDLLFFRHLRFDKALE